MMKSRPKKATTTNPDVSKDDFATVARRLGYDEDKDRFEQRLGKIAKAKPVKKRRRKT